MRMPRQEQDPSYSNLSEQIDQRFPFSTLLIWAQEVKGTISQKKYEQQMQIVRQITLHRDYRETLLREAGLGERDIFIHNPSTGKLIEISHGSFFYPDMLFVLEDKQLDNCVISLIKNSQDEPVIPRGAFASAVDGAVITVGSLVVPHHLSLDDVNTVVKGHCLRLAVNHPLFVNEQEAVSCFYAGMKIIANRLKYSVI